MLSFPDPPQKELPSSSWHHFTMWEKVNDVIYSLPNYFDTELVIKGINVTEIYSIGSAFATVIETQVVDMLNRLRNIWDPHNNYSDYAFFRQSQTFPDVLLRHAENERDILFGVELKSWYVLSKEGEPSFRYKVTPGICTTPDLLVVVPWILSEVISGEPRLLPVYKELAKYAAEYRNYYWQQSRIMSGKSPVIVAPPSKNIYPYPSSKQEASDKATDDKGGNFGRIARANLMDSYVAKIKALDYLGIKVTHWIEFFKAIAETSTDVEIEHKIESLRTRILSESVPTKTEAQSALLEILDQLERMWVNLP